MKVYGGGRGGILNLVGLEEVYFMYRSYGENKDFVRNWIWSYEFGLKNGRGWKIGREGKKEIFS